MIRSDIHVCIKIFKQPKREDKKTYYQNKQSKTLIHTYSKYAWLNHTQYNDYHELCHLLSMAPVRMSVWPDFSPSPDVHRDRDRAPHLRSTPHMAARWPNLTEVKRREGPDTH